MPGYFSKHGFSQSCPGRAYVQNGIGPKRSHNEACKRGMEEEIGKDEANTKADKLKKGRITSLHSKLNNTSAREICGERMRTSLRMSM